VTTPSNTHTIEQSGEARALARAFLRLAAALDEDDDARRSDDPASGVEVPGAPAVIGPPAPGPDVELLRAEIAGVLAHVARGDDGLAAAMAADVRSALDRLPDRTRGPLMAELMTAILQAGPAERRPLMALFGLAASDA
jgi:hypothetical protein